MRDARHPVDHQRQPGISTGVLLSGRNAGTEASQIRAHGPAYIGPSFAWPVRVCFESSRILGDGFRRCEGGSSASQLDDESNGAGRATRRFWS
jgi:hypothetical protein